MIGVIGPSDSTALALAVAAEEGLSDQVVGRAYGSVEEARGLAAELARICQVVLFTGRVPYALARASDELRASLRYVPHPGADLYRTLVHRLREFHGELPRSSLDTIQSSAPLPVGVPMAALPAAAGLAMAAVYALRRRRT